MESSGTREWTLVPCIGRQMLNHLTTREVPSVLFYVPKLSGSQLVWPQLRAPPVFQTWWGHELSGWASPLFEAHWCLLWFPVGGKKYPGSENGIQVVVIDGRPRQMLNHTSFRNTILQGIPWQLFNYMVTIPDKWVWLRPPPCPWGLHHSPGWGSLGSLHTLPMASQVAQQVKNLAANAGDTTSIPGLGRFPGEGNGNLLQYSFLENPMDRGAWWATVHGFTKSQMWLSDWAHMHISLYVYELWWEGFKVLTSIFKN